VDTHEDFLHEDVTSEFIETWLGDEKGMLIHREGNVSSIVRPVKRVHHDEPVAQIVKYFTDFEYETGVVVVRDEEPVGLVMREKLFQRLAFKYGYALFWQRPISNIMDESPLLVEAGTPLDTVSKLAMERHRDKVYDLVVVTDKGSLRGVVTIRDMLNVITKMQMELAREANPLTGLPGNRRIEGEIQRRIDAGASFAIVYVDLDSFKWFNDEYGFQRGDLVLRFTAAILREALENTGDSEGFIGHIGGDDFLLVTEEDYTSDLTESIIHRFDKEVPRFYPDSRHIDAFKNGQILEQIVDRRGLPVSPQGIAISLSVLQCRAGEISDLSLELISREAGEIKKTAKLKPGSTVVVQMLPAQA
jgi:GGDEF domain-containing protein